MIVFRNNFCNAGWKSLHILLAIIKLSGLNVFICIYRFCGRHRTNKCSSKQNACSERFDWLSYLPVNMCISISLHTRFTQTGWIISEFTHVVQTKREWQTNINNLIFLPGIVVLLLIVLHSFLTGELNMMYCSNVVSERLICLCSWGPGFGRWFGTFAFSAIRLKCAFSKIFFCSFNSVNMVIKYINMRAVYFCSFKFDSM